VRDETGDEAREDAGDAAGKGDAEDRGDSGLFAEAIAAFKELEDEEPTPEAKKAKKRARKKSKKKRKKERKSAKRSAKKGSEEEDKVEGPADDAADKGDAGDKPEESAGGDDSDQPVPPPRPEKPTVEYSVRPPEAPADEKADEKAGGKAEEKAEPGDEGEESDAKLVEVRPGDDLLKGAEPPGSPTSVEVYDDKIKFTCQCGKRISAPIQTKKLTGKCPRCGRRLTIPSVKLDAKAERKPGAKAGARCRACGRRQADADATFCANCGAKLNGSQVAKEKEKDDEPVSERTSARMAADEAAERMRPRTAKTAVQEKPKAAASVPGAGDGPATFIGRLLALLIDMMATFMVLIIVFLLLKETAGASIAAAIAAATAGVAWFINEVAFSSLNGQTIGKAVVRISVRRSGDDGLAGTKMLLVRALVKTVFLPGALMAAFDERGRAVHDNAAGTKVVNGWHPPGKNGSGQ